MHKLNRLRKLQHPFKIPLFHVFLIFILTAFIYFLINNDSSNLAITEQPVQVALPSKSPSFNHANRKAIFTVTPGDSLKYLAKKAGLTSKTIHELLTTDQDTEKLSLILPEKSLIFSFDHLDRLVELEYKLSPIKSFFVSKTLYGYQSQWLHKKFETRLSFYDAIIDNSLFLAGQKAGMDDNLIMELANLFSWDIDFAQDIRAGDRFKLLNEELYLDDAKHKNGSILIAEFINQGRKFSAVLFEDKNNKQHYDFNGKSVRKTFRRNPLDIVHISSRYNLKRKHPILNRIRAHKGIDYSAKRGTPVRASGDGKVIFKGRKGGYGKTIILQHGLSYQTLYAHLNHYEKSLKKSSTVKQGQIIGFVGSSGLATGPHLHYEFRINGHHINPLTVKFPATKPIAHAQQPAFFKQANYLEELLLSYSNLSAATYSSLNRIQQ